MVFFSYLFEYGHKDESIKKPNINNTIVLFTITVLILYVLTLKFSYYAYAQIDNAISGRVDLHSDDKTALFVSSSNIFSSATSTGTPQVQDLDGNAMNSTKTSSFTTVISADIEKYFVAIMRANHDNQQTLIETYKPYVNSEDKILSHPNDENLQYTMQLPGKHGVQYFSLDEIRSNVASLKAQGVDIISYDLEKEYSPNSDLQNPLASVKAASEVVHQNKMKFMITPSINLTTHYGTQFAPFVDMYNIQAQSLQSKPYEYRYYVDQIVKELRLANPEMAISVQVSTTRGTLESMKKSFWLVADIVDGTSSWYSNDLGGLNKIRSFIEWFNHKYR